MLNSQLIESNKTNESLRNELAICDSVIKLNQKSNREGMYARRNIQVIEGLTSYVCTGYRLVVVTSLEQAVNL